MYSEPGIYRHYKGGYYRVLGVARHESNGANLVIYQSLDVEHELERAFNSIDFVARPLNPEDLRSGADLDPFNTLVEWESGEAERFEPVLKL